jgi:hypothetical protein
VKHIDGRSATKSALFRELKGLLLLPAGRVVHRMAGQKVFGWRNIVLVAKTGFQLKVA